MKKRVLQYFTHIFFTIILLLIVGIIILLSQNGSVSYGDNPGKINLEGEGPYVFYTSDSTFTINYLRGNKNTGFFVDQTRETFNHHTKLSCLFKLDSSVFELPIDPIIVPPKSIYEDDQPIIAISDIESGYKTFRDYLISNKVIDHKLNWIFEKGHLILVGDFVDRGFSTTQVLWFIYKLEQDAERQGGKVHFILGNHELYNLQGNFKSAAYKYSAIAAVLGKQHHELYDNNSLLGRWLASKNSIERINGHIFTHGGIHPDILNYDINIPQLNSICRSNIRKPYFPKPGKTVDQLILSNKTGLSWYRGYFKDNLSQTDLEKILHKFDAKSVIVGHTIQSRVKKLYDGRLFAIDVKHPKDYNKNWSRKHSEGLLFLHGKYFRLLANGQRIEL